MHDERSINDRNVTLRERIGVNCAFTEVRRQTDRLAPTIPSKCQTDECAAKHAPVWVRMGEKLERGWHEVLDWDMRYTRFILRRLDHLNRTSRRPVNVSCGPVVSLTTYGKRIYTVYLAIESIARGTVSPSRLILWLDDERLFRALPESLKRLQTRGLEIRMSENYGPHTKYYPYLLSTDAFNTPLATADDDTIYPENWLSGLQRNYETDPQVISCYRAHEIRFFGGGLAPYVTWGRCRSNVPGFHHFLTGVSGCIYPPGFLEKLKSAGLGFLSVCPKADDVWLHVTALRNGYRVKQVHPWQRTFSTTPDTQNMGLAVTNVDASQNDAQIAMAYTQQDIAVLKNEANELFRNPHLTHSLSHFR